MLYRQNKSISEMLINNGAEINKQDKNGNTVLHYLLENEKHDLYMYNFFINRGADIFIKNKKGISANDIYQQNKTKYDKTQKRLDNEKIQEEYIQATKDGNITKVKNYVGSYIFLNKEEGFKVAIENDRVYIIEYLLSKGVDINIEFGRYSALMIAAKENNIRTAIILIKHKANVNMIISRHTALDCAKNETMINYLKQNKAFKYSEIDTTVKEWNTDIIKQAINTGLNIDAKFKYNSTNRTLSFLSVVNNDMDMLQFLVKNGCKLTSLESDYAIKDNNLEILKYLNENGCQILFKNAKNANEEIKDYLKSITTTKSKDELNNLTDKELLSEISKTISIDNLEYFKILLSKTKANKKQLSEFFMKAVSMNAFKIVDYLTKTGADINYQAGKKGMTALGITNSVKMADLLLKNGADINYTDTSSAFIK